MRDERAEAPVLRRPNALVAGALAPDDDADDESLSALSDEAESALRFCLSSYSFLTLSISL